MLKQWEAGGPINRSIFDSLKKERQKAQNKRPEGEHYLWGEEVLGLATISAFGEGQGQESGVGGDQEVFFKGTGKHSLGRKNHPLPVNYLT